MPQQPRDGSILSLKVRTDTVFTMTSRILGQRLREDADRFCMVVRVSDDADSSVVPVEMLRSPMSRFRLESCEGPGWEIQLDSKTPFTAVDMLTAGGYSL
jgi:hypothetical protein